LLVYKNVTFPIKIALTTIQPPKQTPPPEKASILKSILKFVIDFRFLIALGIVGVTSITTVVVVIWKRPERVVPPPTVTQAATPTVIPPSRRPPRTTRIAYSWPLPNGNQPVAVLESLAGANHGKQWIVDHRIFKVGSAGDNDLVLERDDFVSSHHATIKAEGQSLYVTDLGSRNGTRVNGELLKSGTRPLLPGDQIGLGQTLIEVRSASAENVRANHGAAQRG
jgi:hypothetical protein